MSGRVPARVDAAGDHPRQRQPVIVVSVRIVGDMIEITREGRQTHVSLREREQLNELHEFLKQNGEGDLAEELRRVVHGADVEEFCGMLGAIARTEERMQTPEEIARQVYHVAYTRSDVPSFQLSIEAGIAAAIAKERWLPEGMYPGRMREMADSIGIRMRSDTIARDLRRWADEIEQRQKGGAASGIQWDSIHPPSKGAGR